MKFTQQDFKEIEFVGELLTKIESLNPKEAIKISDRIAIKQPFMIALLIGYNLDVKEEQLDEILKMLFLIFLFFEKQIEIDKYQVNQIDFESHHLKNIEFLKDYSMESIEKTELKSFEIYLSNLRFKSLFTGILIISDTSINFRTLSIELRGMIIICMKTLIDCLESNLLENKVQMRT